MQKETAREYLYLFIIFIRSFTALLKNKCEKNASEFGDRSLLNVTGRNGNTFHLNAGILAECTNHFRSFNDRRRQTHCETTIKLQWNSHLRQIVTIKQTPANTCGVWRCCHPTVALNIYLVAVYVPVSLTCYVCRRINSILAHVVSALPRLLY